MAKLGISTGTNPNDGSGDSLLAGAVKINSNFNEVYAAIGNGSTVSTPVTSITAGDNIIVSGSTGSVTITGIGTADIDTDRINVSGVVTASSFSGSGVNLTNLPSSALVGTLPAVSGANLTGIATFIDAGANITVTTGPTGVTTIASSSGSATTSNVSSNTLVVTGVSTLGITSTTSLTSQQLNVSGVSTISGTVGFGTNITLPDGAKAKFGTGGDLEIYHSGTNSFIVDSGTGGLYVRSSTGYIQDQGNANQTWLQFNSAAGVEAHFAGNKKFETTGYGVTVTGTTFSNQLNVTGVSTFSGSVSFASTDTAVSFASSVTFGDNDKIYLGDDDDVEIYWDSSSGRGILDSSGGWDMYGQLIYLYYYNNSADTNTERLQVNSRGITITGDSNIITGGLQVTGITTFGGNVKLGDAQKAYFGASNDLEIYHGGSLDNHGYLTSTNGNLYLTSASNGSVRLRGYNKTNLIVQSTSVQLLYDTSLKLETTAKGVSVAGIVTASSGIVTYHGDGSQLTDGRWTLGANGTSDYTFTGIGLTQTTNDPILYLARGRVYEFVNSMGAHPFEIRQSAGGSAYNSGVTNNAVSNGTLRFEIPFDAPNTLYYQCTSHAGMGSTIVVYPNTI